MPTRQYKIARDFHIFDRSLMISPHRLPPVVFSVETRIFFSPDKLLSAYKLIFQNSKPLCYVYILIEYILRVQILLQKRI